jgi:hypothetical protein
MCSILCKLCFHYFKLVIFICFAGVFYYVLGNIRTIFRSSIQNIQLICIAKTNDIKDYGIDNLLLPFIQEVNHLAQVI